MTLINKKTTEQSIRSIMKSFKGETEFKLTPGELDTALHHCNMLKDMSTLAYEDGKKLQKNVSIISTILLPIQADANLLNERRDDMNERASKATTQEELEKLKEDRKKHAVEVKTYNEKKHSIHLFKVPEDKFITEEKDKANFGVKKINQQQGPPLEVERYPCFLELLGLGIISEKE